MSDKTRTQAQLKRNREYMRRRRVENREALNARRRQLYAENLEANRGRKRKWRRAGHAEAENKRTRKWRAEHPEAVRDYSRKYYNEHREASRKYAHEYYRRPGPKEARRGYNHEGHLKHRYGLSAEMYNALLATQGGGCAICGQTKTRRRLDVDHNHITGKVRGLLCGKCNRAISQAEDNPERLMRMADYLRLYDGKEPQNGGSGLEAG